MFSSKENFKKEFLKRLEEKYGNDVPDSHIFEQYDILGEMVRDYAGKYWRETKDKVIEGHKKQVVYFSMEFLIGRLLINNMQNLGIYDVAKQGLEELGLNIHNLEEQESDAGLGNGGLGRLAACFLDSISSLGYPVIGNCIRYEYGFFRQIIEKDRQFEVPDQWLTNGFSFEVRKPKHAVEVQFGGNPESYLKKDGSFGLRTVNTVHVKAVPYDVSIIGYKNKVVNTLRLWSAEPSELNLPKGMEFEEYLNRLKELSHGLYPDDSNEKGKLLRLRQQYFFVSSGLQSILRGHYRRFKTLLNLDEYYVFQLNDTHPVILIPELMRLMMDNYGYGWDDAWNVVQKTVAFTNHTIMQEALEKWSTGFIREVSPRCLMIIEELDRRFNEELAKKNVSSDVAQEVRILKDGLVYMANLAIYASFSVNGVAALHTEILKKETFKGFYSLYPDKFNNKTNGVTHRRWLLYSNPELANLITSKIGDSWILDMENKLKDFKEFTKDKDVQDKFLEIKQTKKQEFADYIYKKMGIELDVNSIFDVQVKRLHAYKRQLMNIFNVMYQYNRMKSDPTYRIYPHTYIFGAKAAPSYAFAKKVINLICCVANVVNNDPEISKYMKVVFVENYGVSLAEKIIPAADVSEQISTASKEASGTSNMKFMMNGSVTLGTLDGANVEICDLVGKENIVIFGLTSNQVLDYYAKGGYNAREQYNSSCIVKNVIDSLLNGPWVTKPDQYQMIFDELINNNDYFFVLKDLESYVKAQEYISQMYQNKTKWAEMCLNNVAMSGFFTSDRTIREYIRDIWHLGKVNE